MAKVVCVYHKADLDGKTAAAVVLDKYPDAVLVPADYGDVPDISKFDPASLVIVVDWSFPPEVFAALMQRQAGNVLWIDHHESAIKKVAEIGLSIPGIQMESRSGCELAWMFLNPGKPMPRAVQLNGAFDVFDLAEPSVIPFQFGVRAECPEPAQIVPLLSLPEDGLKPIVEKGDTVLRVKVPEWERQVQNSQFVDWEGRTWRAVNAQIDPVAFHFFPPNPCQGTIAYYKTTEAWKVGLYAADLTPQVMDKIATKYGGGGHPGAAGFTSSYLPWVERAMPPPLTN